MRQAEMRQVPCPQRLQAFLGPDPNPSGLHLRPPWDRTAQLARFRDVEMWGRGDRTVLSSFF